MLRKLLWENWNRNLTYQLQVTFHLVGLYFILLFWSIRCYCYGLLLLRIYLSKWLLYIHLQAFLRQELVPYRKWLFCMFWSSNFLDRLGLFFSWSSFLIFFPLYDDNMDKSLPYFRFSLITMVCRKKISSDSFYFQ